MSMIANNGKKVCFILSNGNVVTKIMKDEKAIWELDGDVLVKFAVDVAKGTAIFYNNDRYLAPEDYKAGDYVYFAKGTFHPTTFRITLNSLEFCNYYSEIYMLKGFDFSNVTSMWIFCYVMPLLTKLDVSHLDTSKITSMDSSFRAISISSLDVSNFDTSNVTTFFHIFNSSSNLTNIIFGPKWGTQTTTSSEGLLLGLNSCGSSKSYQLTDETYNSMLTMYDRASAGLATMTIKFNKNHNIPDGFTEKMTALGYTITLA